MSIEIEQTKAMVVTDAEVTRELTTTEKGTPAKPGIPIRDPGATANPAGSPKVTPKP